MNTNWYDMFYIFMQRESLDLGQVFLFIHQIMMSQYFKKSVVVAQIYIGEQKIHDFYNCIHGEESLREIIQKTKDSFQTLCNGFNLQDVIINIEQEEAKFFDIIFEPQESNKYIFETRLYNCNKNYISIKSIIYEDLSSVLYMKDLKTSVCNILKQIIINKTFYVKDIDVLTDYQKNLLLNEFRGSNVEVSDNMTLFSRLKYYASLCSYKTAIIFENTYVTYQELENKTNQIANYLLSKGVAQGSFVVVYINRSNYMMELILGLWKVGAVYIPIDKSYPKQRAMQIIAESNPNLIVINENSSPFTWPDSKQCHIEDIMHESSYFEPRFICNVDSPEQLAAIMFTSGSTGKPKGVMLEHGGILNHMYAKIMDTGMDENSILAQNASQSFVISLWQFLSPLLIGGTTVILSDDTIISPDLFLNVVSYRKITVLEVVPSYLDVILDFVDDVSKIYLAGLSIVVVTGEKLPYRLIQRWFQKFPSIPLMNAYGATELSDDIAHHVFKQIPENDVITLGHTIQNNNIYIVDSLMNLCPIGISGEICAGGPAVARGYLNDKERTKQVFLQNPFNDHRERLYKIGDYGRFLPNGNIEFFGRKDEQVKVRGNRIELGDVCNLIFNHPDVKNAVVLCKEDKYGTNYLCAYIIASRHIDAEEIRFVIKEYGPDYMVPSEFVFLEKFPLSGNGKIDKSALMAN